MLGNNLGLMQTVGGLSYTYATWNPADKTNATLSNGNLTIAATTGSSAVGARATQGISTGKWYWEVRRGLTGSATTYIGIANSSQALSSSTGANSLVYTSGGVVYAMGSYVAPVSSAQNGGDILGLALDADAKTVTFYVNGVSQGSWSYTFTGPVYPFYNCTDNNSGNTSTANFGASMLKFQPPAGFNAGLFTASGLPTFATWNPSDKGAGVTLSGGNLTVSEAGYGVRSTLSVTTGKWHIEYKAASGSYASLGVASSSASLSGYPGSDTYSYVFGMNGAIYYNSVDQGGGYAWTSSDTLGLSIDADARTVTLYINGLLKGTKSIPFSGAIYVITGSYYTSTAVSTTNFGATPFTYAPPAGYSHGLASAAFAPTINYATWDANDKSSLTTLSNANLTETTSGGNGGAHSTVGKSRGKWYWETTVVTSAQLHIGVGTFAAGVNIVPGNASGSVAWNPTNANLRYNGTTGYSLPSMSANDVAGIAVDDTAGTITFYKNGGLAGGPYSMVTAGTHYFAFDGALSSSADTANFGASALKFAPPAGYSWGLGDRPTPFSRSHATLDPSNKGAEVTLSNGNLSFAADYNSGTRHSSRLTIGKTYGKWYFEATLTGLGSAGVPGMVGICTAAVPQSTVDCFCYPAPSAGNGIGYYGGTGIVYSNGAPLTTAATYTTGDVVGVAFDAATRVAAFYKNGTLVYTAPALGGADAIYAAIGYSGRYTANFGATPFAYPAPQGYTGLY